MGFGFCLIIELLYAFMFCVVAFGVMGGLPVIGLRFMGVVFSVLVLDFNLD